MSFSYLLAAILPALPTSDSEAFNGQYCPHDYTSTLHFPISTLLSSRPVETRVPHSLRMTWFQTCYTPGTCLYVHSP